MAAMLYELINGQQLVAVDVSKSIQMRGTPTLKGTDVFYRIASALSAPISPPYATQSLASSDPNSAKPRRLERRCGGTTPMPPNANTRIAWRCRPRQQSTGTANAKLAGWVLRCIVAQAETNEHGARSAVSGAAQHTAAESDVIAVRCVVTFHTTETRRDRVGTRGKERPHQIIHTLHTQMPCRPLSHST